MKVFRSELEMSWEAVVTVDQGLKWDGVEDMQG